MCTVSNVGDYYNHKTLPDHFPSYPSWPQGIPPTREEFDELKRSVEALKELLLAAKEYDRKMGEPDCEMEDKVALIKKLAEIVGVDLSQIF